MKSLLAIVFCFVATAANAEKQGIVCENGICRIVPIVRVWAAVEQPTPAPVESKPVEVVSEPQVMHSVLIHHETVQPVRTIVGHCQEHKPARGLLKRVFGRR